jgi:Ala-tRNA(Pro) deacylase
MSVSRKLQDFLEKESVPFSKSQHEVAYTAQEIAGAGHVPGKDFVKSILVKADGRTVLCVLSANHMIDFEKLKAVLNAKEIELADESEIATLFPEYEIGAMPPFGRSHSLDTYIDSSLQEDENIVFNAGTHTDLIRIKLDDFIRVEKPKIVSFGMHV